MGLLLIADDVIMGPYGTGPIWSPTPLSVWRVCSIHLNNGSLSDTGSDNRTSPWPDYVAGVDV